MRGNDIFVYLLFIYLFIMLLRTVIIGYNRFNNNILS